MKGGREKRMKYSRKKTKEYVWRMIPNYKVSEICDLLNVSPYTVDELFNECVNDRRNQKIKK